MEPNLHTSAALALLRSCCHTNSSGLEGQPSKAGGELLPQSTLWAPVDIRMHQICNLHMQARRAMLSGHKRPSCYEHHKKASSVHISSMCFSLQAWHLGLWLMVSGEITK